MSALKGVTVQWGKDTFGAVCYEPRYRKVLLQWGGAGGIAGDFLKPLDLKDIHEET